MKTNEALLEEYPPTFRAIVDQTYGYHHDGTPYTRHVDIVTEAVSDPHNIHRMVVEVEDPQGGTIKNLGIAPKFSETPGEVRWIEPRVGEHTDEVLESLGYDATAIGSLRERGVAE